MNLSNMEHSFTESSICSQHGSHSGGDEPHPKNQLCNDLETTPVFKVIRDTMRANFDLADSMVAILAVEDNSSMDLDAGGALKSDHHQLQTMLAEAVNSNRAIKSTLARRCSSRLEAVDLVQASRDLRDLTLLHKDVAAQISMFWICFASCCSSFDKLNTAFPK